MKLSECQIFDNYSLYVTHGITLISSTLFVESTTISFSPTFLDQIIQMNLDKVDTGFFNLYLGSDLHLSQGTVVSGLTALKWSVLSAIS